MKKRVIAIHLPQFHPFKENDEWWGKGFTEWTNVVKAKPRFRNHYQPHLPADMGFYDLRVPETRNLQAQMAHKYGIYGFCYYHYWFNGRRLMERPVNDILSSEEPDFPFMLCWANENWARNWDGGFKNVLIEQKYSDEDDINHMNYLCSSVFSDKRYIRVDGKPFFAIYKPELFPNIARTLTIWREVASKYGISLYLAFMENSRINPKQYLEYGFDAAIDFQPLSMGTFLKNRNFAKKILSKTLGVNFSSIFNYADYVKYRCEQPLPDYKQYSCVSPGWDNSPRRVGKPFLAFKNSSPSLYGEWLRNTLERSPIYSQDENFIFINAWNEWAEGNHLEPDQKWGCKYLDETKNAIVETCVII
jgi:hypothetical protein